METRLKAPARTPQAEGETARRVVAEMLAAIEAGGEAAVRAYAARLDRWSGPIVMERDAIARRIAEVPDAVKADIAAATASVRRFAAAQRQSVQDFAIELAPGLTAGQKLVPCNVAGCYVPTGRYAHIASAIMSIATAQVRPACRA